MALVEAGDATVRSEPHGRTRQVVEHAADHMAQGMATERVTAQQYHVDRQNQRAHPDAEGFIAGGRIDEPHRLPNILEQEEPKPQRDEQKIPVNILQDQRKGTLARVLFFRLRNGAGNRVEKKRLVISPPVIITGEPEQARRPQDQQGRGEGQPARPPTRFRPEQAMRRSTEYLRRIQGRQVRTVVIILPLKRRPGGVDHKGREADKSHNGTYPPSVAAGGLAEAGDGVGYVCFGHG